MANHLDVRQMVAADPKGPERGARPYSVVELRDRIAQEISDADGGASSVDPDGDATYEQMADAALAVVAPEVERLTFERDAAQAAADLLVQQLEDLRDDVLGDESLLVPEIVSAAGRTVERLTAETTQLRADLRIRQGALNDVLGRERSADYYSAVEDVAELKRENGRLTAEVERLRDATDRVVELEHDADRVRDALLPILRGHRYTQHEVQGDWLRSGYVAERAANLLRRDAAVENSLRGERDRAVLPQDADEQIHTALEVNTGVHTGGQLADQTDAVLALIRSWGVSSSEAEAPRPQEMTQHRVNIDRARWDDRVSFAACRDCPEKCCGDPSDVEFWRDRHQADTLRPTLTNESFISSQDEGRPSGSEAAGPRSDEELRAKLDLAMDTLGSIWLYVNWHYVSKQLTTEQKELWADAVDEFGDPEDRGPKAERWWRDDAPAPAHDEVLERLRAAMGKDAAQAARGEATPEDENDAIEFTRYLGGAQS